MIISNLLNIYYKIKADLRSRLWIHTSQKKSVLSAMLNNVGTV